MSLAQLKDQATHLDVGQQRELIAFLIARQTEHDEDFKRTLAQKIDDTDPSHWVELDDLQKRYRD
jgi:Mn-containing catalase